MSEPSRKNPEGISEDSPYEFQEVAPGSTTNRTLLSMATGILIGAGFFGGIALGVGANQNADPAPQVSQSNQEAVPAESAAPAAPAEEVVVSTEEPKIITSEPMATTQPEAASAAPGPTVEPAPISAPGFAPSHDDDDDHDDDHYEDHDDDHDDHDEDDD
ncbi:MAG: hypothetical protein VW991_01715 [Aquiluna sp.]